MTNLTVKQLRCAALGSVLAVAASMMTPSLAYADATSEARVLFEAGANAYQAGDYKGAIAAFEQAYRIDPRPGLLFSIAQAHRRQYILDRRPGHVAVALKRLRDYLNLVPEGGRRADALAALAEIEPVALKLEGEGQLQPLDDADTVSRLMVSCSTPTALVRVDDEKEGKAAPRSLDLAPGKHTVILSAEGYFDEKREVEVVKGSVVALDIPLREKPAQLKVNAPAGSEVYVDARLVGKTPLGTVVDVTPGKHQVWVAQNGRVGQHDEIFVQRGENRTITAPLPWTLQRKAALGLGGAGVIALGVGIAGGIAAAGADAQANDIRKSMEAGKVVCKTGDCPQLDLYNGSLASRDAFRTLSGVMLSVGVLSLGTGAVLFFMDNPGPAPKVREASPGTDTSPSAPRALEISAAPMVLPGGGGAFISGQF
ncbi:MAG: PEGA domain-containing protein [Polyangiaceae bacterium]|nr:PEGA domain-containing protein [Polyangiaceae bacterium]